MYRFDPRDCSTITVQQLAKVLSVCLDIKLTDYQFDYYFDEEYKDLFLHDEDSRSYD